jgi:hypothetical protein
MKEHIKTLIGEGDYSGHVLTRKLPIKIDNALYSLIHFIGGMTTYDVIDFANNATEDDIEELYNLIIDFPNTIQTIMPMAGNYKVLRNSKQYQKIIDLIKMEDMEEEMIAEHDDNDSDTIPLPGADGFYTTDTNPYFTRYFKPIFKEKLFKLWDSLGKADYDSLKLFGVDAGLGFGEDVGQFHNVGEIIYPILALEWLGGVENTEFAKADWETTDEAGWYNLKFKVEPVGYDYMFDESENFGEQGYACWDIRILIDKDGDFDPEDEREDGVLPHIQELFPESAQNKLSSFRNYTEDQYEVIELLWEYYHDKASEYWSQFCKVEVKLV